MIGYSVVTATTVCRYYKAFRSAGGFRRRLRSLTRKNTEQNAEGADTGVRDVRCKLQNLKMPTTRRTTRTAHAYTKHMTRTERRSSAVCYALRLKTKWPKNTKLITPAKSCFVSGRSYIFVGRAHFDFFIHFENAASSINARRHAGSRKLCLLACVVALWSARTWFAALCRIDCAMLCCACDTVADARRHAHMYIVYLKKAHKNKHKKYGKRRLFFWKKREKNAPASIRRRRCSSGSSERPERCQWSPLRKKD